MKKVVKSEVLAPKISPTYLKKRNFIESLSGNLQSEESGTTFFEWGLEKPGFLISLGLEGHKLITFNTDDHDWTTYIARVVGLHLLI